MMARCRCGRSPVRWRTRSHLWRLGTAVRVIDEVDGSDGMKWYKVQISYNGMASTGYIRSDFITLSTEDTSAGSTITDNSAQGAAGVVTNTNGNVYVRTGASTAYSPVTMVKRDQTVNVLGQTTTNGTIWYNVTFNKEWGGLCRVDLWNIPCR